MQEASGWSTTPNVARTISCKAWNSPAEYPSWVSRCDIKGSDGTMLNPIFWKKVQGQKHPGRWGIVKHQIPSIKVLFKTNAKSYISTWICNHMPCKMWDEITYQHPNSNGATVEVWEWISNCIPHLYNDCNYLPRLRLQLIHKNKRNITTCKTVVSTFFTLSVKDV